MSVSPAARPGDRPGLRWFVWTVFLVGWTTALLTPQPVYLADALLPEETRFSAAKALHVAAYAVLAILSGWLRAPGPWPRRLVVLLCLHAMATEYLQGFVPERGPSVEDVGFDHIGICWGIILSWRLWRASA
jgi:VanZ family protein